MPVCARRVFDKIHTAVYNCNVNEADIPFSPPATSCEEVNSLNILVIRNRLIGFLRMNQETGSGMYRAGFIL